MPGGDRTGPMGMGSMTGRGAGFCAGYGMPGGANSSFGRGYGMGFGRGGGFRGRSGGGGFRWRNWFHATGAPLWMRSGSYPAPQEYYPGPLAQADPEMQRRSLQYQADALKAELESIQNRLAEMEQQQETK